MKEDDKSAYAKHDISSCSDLEDVWERCIYRKKVIHKALGSCMHGSITVRFCAENFPLLQ